MGEGEPTGWPTMCTSRYGVSSPSDSRAPTVTNGDRHERRGLPVVDDPGQRHGVLQPPASAAGTSVRAALLSTPAGALPWARAPAACDGPGPGYRLQVRRPGGGESRRPPPAGRDSPGAGPPPAPQRPVQCGAATAAASCLRPRCGGCPAGAWTVRPGARRRCAAVCAGTAAPSSAVRPAGGSGGGMCPAGDERIERRTDRTRMAGGTIAGGTLLSAVPGGTVPAHRVAGDERARAGDSHPGAADRA